MSIDFQAPVLERAKQQFENVNAWHYGILVGGMPLLVWPDTGQQSVGHGVIVRRRWMIFKTIPVGRRPEYDGALDSDMTAIQIQWATNPERVVEKSARSCAQDVVTRHGEQGYVVPEIMMGHLNPQGLAERVWPLKLRETQRLYQNITYLESFSTDDEEEAALAAELLGAHYACREYVAEYVRVLKQEMAKEHGLKTLNAALEELFHEVNEPLPERKNLAIAQEMGKAIGGDSRKDDATINVLNAIAEGLKSTNARLEALEQSGTGHSPTTEGAVAPNTQPGVKRDGSPDLRFKANKGAD